MIDDMPNIYAMEIQELWSLFNKVISDHNVEQGYRDEIHRVRHGCHLSIPIHWFVNGWYIPYPDTRLVTIRGYGKRPLTLFMNEKEERERIMRSILDIELSNEGRNEPRVI